MEANGSRIGRVAGVVVLLLFVAGVTGGTVAIGAAAWRLIPNHPLAVGAIVLIVPLFLWGLTQDE